MAQSVVALLFYIVAFDYVFIDAFRSDYTYIESTRSYYKYHREKATWADAKSMCISESAVLFHPENEKELTQVLDFLSVGDNDGDYLYTGINDLRIFKVYETVDGRPISQVYSKWKSGEPYPCSNNLCRCGSLDAVANYEMIINICNSIGRYICKSYQNIPTGKVEMIIDAFRSDYTYIESTRSYYKYHREKATWADAKSMCISENAVLFHPENKPELTEVLDILGVGDDNGEYIYTGINDIRNLKVYETVDGHPISQVFSKWRSGEPYSCSLNECRCGSLDPKAPHEMIINFCNDKRRYICKNRQNMSTNQVERIIDTVSSGQTTVLERLVEAVEAMQRQAANQTAALERLTANQVRAIDKQTEVMQRFAANQTASSERQAVALEKLTSSQEKQPEQLSLFLLQ